MTKLKRLWPALELPNPLSGVRAHLRRFAGSETALALSFCRTLREASDTYPCPTPGGEGCPRRVARRPDGQIVAVCGGSPRECDTISLRPEDLLVYQLDPQRLCRILAESFALRPACEPIRDCDLWQVGFLPNGASNGRPVFLVLHSGASRFAPAIDHLLARFEQPFVVLAPTLRFADARLNEHLRRRSAALVSLEDSIVSSGGKLSAVAPLAGLLGQADTSEPTPPKTMPDTAPFAPQGVGWPDVEIRFLDGHTVSIRAGEKREVKTFAEMRMVNRKNGNPTVQWELLRALAEKQGTLNWRSPAADRKNQKRIEILGKNLRAFFGAADSPFHDYRPGTGWRAKFTVLPER
jgi:hypothetical protein